MICQENNQERGSSNEMMTFTPLGSSNTMRGVQELGNLFIEIKSTSEYQMSESSPDVRFTNIRNSHNASVRTSSLPASVQEVSNATKRNRYNKYYFGQFCDQDPIYLIIDDSQLILNGVMVQDTQPLLLKKYTRDPRQTESIIREQIDEGRAFLFILVDLEMPGLSGIEVMQMIRQVEKEKALDKLSWVVGMKTSDDERTEQHILSLGFNQVLMKPQ